MEVNDALTVAGSGPQALPIGQLYRACDLTGLAFTSTVELEPIDGLVGQARAFEAVGAGAKIDKKGFNLFVIGPNSVGMQEAVKTVLAQDARSRPNPPDWVYVNNFAKPDRPIAIQLPSGRAPDFKEAMRKLVEDLKIAAPAAFQSEDYQTRRSAIDEAFQKKQFEAFSELREKAGEKAILLLRTPVGFALAPSQDGQVVPPDEFNAWPEPKRLQAQADIEALEADLEHIVRQIPQWDKQRRDDVRALNRETAKFAVDHLIEEVAAAFADLPRVAQHIDTVRADLIENVPMFVARSDGAEGETGEPVQWTAFDRYEVNVLIAQNGAVGAPVVEELHPTLGNLIGRIDYVSSHGVLMTNFRLIKSGAIHRASGGYLLIDVRSLLIEPFSWTALKRALRRGEIVIEDVGRFLGLTSTVSLEPDPIPLQVKVVLFGDRLLYFLLSAFDPDLGEHFKILADFEDDLARNPENEAIFARLVGSLARRDGLRPLDRQATARVVEHAARLAAHSGKLSLRVNDLREALIEADLCAREAKRDVVARPDVERALQARIRRASRLRDRMQEAILERVALIATEGARVGQVNGLSVVEIGGFTFGGPTRITCQTRPGAGKVVDIEREVELGGPIHSKGVLILGGFLAGRYALDTPMSLFASLVFEQSYGGVEGDSASSAELYALLSALADAPLRQDLAVTGSVNQHGDVQAIGGANEKIEGFFDICNARGLTGSQGVLIPASNVQHLMLREDVVKACAEGRFAVYPIAAIDEGIALLTGLEAGQRQADGAFPPGSVNRRAEDRLRAFADIRK
ncbi:MAG TPA: AAA family ATPase, partial [Roseiarcus sp.]|nr:AAA family ATPase [Roseiarcus sp.]